MLPPDHQGRPRCPTCFRRLIKMRLFDAYRCPSRRCPHRNLQIARPWGDRFAYGITGLELARARR